MNTKTLFIFTSLLFVVLLQGVVFSQEALPLSKRDIKSAITAGDYCQFLNSVAAVDPDHLYNEKMGLSCSSLIVRTGEPGGYYYKVMDGKEEVPIAYVSSLNATHYLTWLQDSSLTFVSNVSPVAFDEALQATDLNFYLIKNSSLNSIQQSSGVEEAGFMEGVIEEGGGILGILTALFAGGEIESEQHRFQNLPDDIQRKAIFLSPEMPSESGGRHAQQYKEALADFQKKDPHLAEQIVSWEEAHHEWLLATEDTKATAYQKLQAMEGALPLNVHLAIAFHRAGAVMNSFNSFQEKWFKDLRGHKKQNTSYLLQSATKANDIIAQATTNVNALLEIMQTCQKESEKEEVKAISFITKKYKIVTDLAFRAIDEYAPLTQVIETKDASRIRSFLQEREQCQTMLVAKPELCRSLLAAYHERMETCRERLVASHFDDRIEILEKAGSCFNNTIWATSCYAQALLEKAGDYYLRCAEEIAAHGVTDEALDLHEAANEARVAGEAFEKAARETSPQAKAAYAKALDYCLRCAEEIATHGVTDRARNLDDAARAARAAGEAFERAASTTSPQAKAAFEKAGDYYLRCAEEIITDGNTEHVRNLNSAARAARAAGEAFEEVASITSPQTKAAFEKALDYELQRAEEIATHGDTQKVKALENAAFFARAAGKAFEELASITSPQARAAFEKALGYELQRAEEIAADGFTNKAASLMSAACAARKEGAAFEGAATTTAPQAKIAFEKAADYWLQHAEEIVVHGDTQKAKNLSFAANEAKRAGEAFEEIARATLPQVEEAYNKALDYDLQATEEMAANGFTMHKARNLVLAANASRAAGAAFEKAVSTTSPQAKIAFEQAAGYELQSAEEIAANGDTNKARDLDSAASAARAEGEAFEKASIST